MQPKTVIISGGTKGIGKGAVLTLLSQGFNVVTFSRNQENLEMLEFELDEKFDSAKYLLLKGDVNEAKDVETIVKQAVEKFKTIDILINNAGIGYFANVDSFDLARFQQMLQTNIVGMTMLTSAVVPIMKTQKSGLIINLSSISGKVAFANGEFYSATKFAVMGYSQAIRAELKDSGIKVSTICPGMIKTDFFDKEELERRMKIWNGVVPTMLEVSDISNIISLVCNQSEHCDIQDLTVMPF